MVMSLQGSNAVPLEPVCEEQGDIPSTDTDPDDSSSDMGLVAVAFQVVTERRPRYTMYTSLVPRASLRT
jgi:hypothetical protein